MLFLNAPHQILFVLLVKNLIADCEFSFLIECASHSSRCTKLLSVSERQKSKSNQQMLTDIFLNDDLNFFFSLHQTS